VKLTYDPVSRIATRTDGRGVVMRFTYDALDRVTQIYYDASAMSSGPPPAASATKTAQLRSRSGSMSPDSADIPPDNGGGTSAQTWINYSYDTDGNLTSRSDSSGNANFSYDLLNRMVKESPEAPSAVVSYTYDLAGNVTSISATDEPAPVRYAYDKTNLVTSIVDQAGRTTTFDYDDKGNRTATHYPNGVTMASKYDDSRRITCTFSYTGSAPAAGSDGSCPDPSTSLLTYVRYHYTGTVNGASADTNRREKADLRDGSTTDYGYDAINRLTDATTKNPAGTVLARYGYDYDDRGDITKQHVTGSSVANRTLTEAYADAGELCWTATGDYTSDCSTPPAGATTYGYNLAGDLTTSSDGLSTTWSMRDHMTSVTPPGSTTPISMTYTDATQDRRVTAGALRMSYNQLGLSNQAPTNASSNATYFVRDPNGLLVGMLTADPATPDDYYVLDGLSSVTATTDESGAVAHRYDYEPFGQEIAPSASDPNPWRFASGYSDTATGMLKFGARYYQPSVARWTQRDPVMGQPGQPLSNNPYAYAGCNPTNNVDPSGRLYEGSDYAANGYQYDWSGVYGACASGMATAGIATLMTGQVELEPVALAGGCVEGMITEMLAQLMPDPADDVFRLFEGIKGVTDLFG
jgi:RHS repeat-associated protein